MEYPVIKITEKHLTRVAELESLCFPCPWNIEQFQHALQDDFTELFGICTEDEGVVAYLLCSVVGDYAEILNIATHPRACEKAFVFLARAKTHPRYSYYSGSAGEKSSGTKLIRAIWF